MLSHASCVRSLLTCLGWLLLVLPPYVHSQEASAPPDDVDTFMARVLERRDQNWKTLHDYVLDETERFALIGPGRVTLYGLQREFAWYVRDGFFVRSPVRFNGVLIDDPERRRYEENWLRREQAREARNRQKAEPSAGASRHDRSAAEAGDPVSTDSPSLEAFVGQRGEPRFVSEAYFLKFKFEPGNYYYAGRERFDQYEVVRIEYYPTRLFAEQDPSDEDEIERKLDKVALITLWVEPSEYQIVKYTFDNMDFGFLPGRWLVRVAEAHASMTMAREFESVWLPRQIEMQAGLTLANGSYEFRYGRGFHDYKKAEVSARIRSVGPEGQ